MEMRVLFYLLQLSCIYSLVKNINIGTKRFLTNEQWKDIKIILKNKKSTATMREKTNEIIYNHYENYAFYKAVNFKKKHSFKCQHISIEELFIYSARGLWKSILKYNSSYPLIPHADMYILNELHLGMSELQPISKIPKSIRRYKTKNIYLPTTYFGSFENNGSEVFEESHNENLDYFNEYANYWEKINGMNPTIKQILKYKYNFYFDKIRTNKEVAHLMSCSQEHIRQEINKFKKYSFDKLRTQKH